MGIDNLDPCINPRHLMTQVRMLEDQISHLRQTYHAMQYTINNKVRRIVNLDLTLVFDPEGQLKYI